jgi:thymidylate synthase (FAD)
MIKIVEPSATLVWATPDAEQTIAFIARTCYQSEDLSSEDSDKKLIQKLIDRKHWPMFDHASMSIKFVTDRGITHELVRHRIAAYAQESTRYCNYSKDKFDNQISVILPNGINEVQPGMEFEEDDIYTSKDIVWLKNMQDCEKAYFDLLQSGCTPQIARSVLPTCLKTSIVMTASFTEWLHVFRLRLSPQAHPDMRSLMQKAKEIAQSIAPIIFSDQVIGL